MQAVGRCIRHRYDYGAILLLDARFSAQAQQQHLSRWVRGSIRPFTTFSDTLQQLQAFFGGLREHPPGPPPALVKAPE